MILHPCSLKRLVGAGGMDGERERGHPVGQLHVEKGHSAHLVGRGDQVGGRWRSDHRRKP